MGKAPAFQFYPGDWSRDLEEHPLEIEGAWIRICCKLWWSETRGSATKTLTNWSRVMRVGEKKSFSILAYLLNQKIADGEINGDQITVTSRRMVKDEYIRNIRANAGRMGGNPALVKQGFGSDLLNQTLVNQNPTPSSSSSSSKINNPPTPRKRGNKIEFDGERFKDIPDTLRSKWTKIAPGVSIDQEIAKAEAWVLSNPKLRKSNWSRFLTNWMIRAQDKARLSPGGTYGQHFNRYGKAGPPELPAGVISEIEAVNKLATGRQAVVDETKTIRLNHKDP